MPVIGHHPSANVVLAADTGAILVLDLVYIVYILPKGLYPLFMFYVC